MLPTKKISLALIEFAEPLINELPPGYSKKDLETILRLAVCVWNSCVLDQWHKTNEHVAAVRKQIAKGQGLEVVVIEALITRKIQLFGDDNRAINNESVVVKNGEFVVRAQARMDLEYIEVSGLAN